MRRDEISVMQYYDNPDHYHNINILFAPSNGSLC